MSVEISASVDFGGMPIGRLAFALSGSTQFVTESQVVFSSVSFLFCHLSSTYMLWHNSFKLRHRWFCILSSCFFWKQ